MYEVEAHWEVGPRGMVHAFYVNGARAGTNAQQVRAAAPGPSREIIAAACADAKLYGRTVYIRKEPAGWFFSFQERPAA